MVVAFGAVVVRLADVQVLSAGRYAGVGVSQRVHSVVLPARRGAILDRNGVELAVSVPRSTVWVDPRLVRDPVATARALAPVLQLDQTTLIGKLTAPQVGFVYLSRRVDDATAAQVRDLALPGVSMLEEPARVSPAGDLAAAVLGQVGIDNDGLSGLERQFDEDLVGRAGEQVVERDPEGRDIAGGVQASRDPVPGKQITLTLDRDLQFAVEQTLMARVQSMKAKGATAIIMDPATGEVLAMASVDAGGKDASGKDLPPRPSSYNKALVDVYEPGSVSKLITLGGAVEKGAIAPTERLSVPDKVTVAGATFSDPYAHQHERWSATEIMAESSNAGAIMIGQKLGRSDLDRYLRAFGFGESTALDFPGESPGILPEPDNYSGTTLATVSIGQGLAVTALQMLAAYNVVANDGMYVPPTLVRSVTDPDGKQRRIGPPDSRRVVSAETARAVNHMLEEAVFNGTGKAAAIPGYVVAGKTGTAKKVEEDKLGYKDGAYVASFVGYLAGESPRLSAIVVVDEPTPYTGGAAAAPVFADLARFAARHLQVPADNAFGPRRPDNAFGPRRPDNAFGPRRPEGGEGDLRGQAATLGARSATRP